MAEAHILNSARVIFLSCGSFELNRIEEFERSPLRVLLFQYQRLQEQIRLIRAESFEPSAEDIRKINQIEAQMKRIYNDTQRLYS